MELSILGDVIDDERINAPHVLCMHVSFRVISYEGVSQIFGGKWISKRNKNIASNSLQ